MSGSAGNKFASVFAGDAVDVDKGDNDKGKSKAAKLENTGITLDISDPNAKDPATGILLRHLDPRPDIKFDHLDWADMLQNALVWDGLQDGDALWGVLHGLRCGGARIQRVPKSELGYKLLPGNEDWKNDEDWQRVRKDYLDGVKDDLVTLFKFTKVHGRLPRMEELWPEGDKPGPGKVVEQAENSQTKIF